MTNAVVRIAHFVLRLMVAVSPREQREWCKAMQAEALHVSPDNALSFALGCLWSMILARGTSSGALLNSARWTLVVGTVAWSALHIRLAGRLAASGANAPSTLAYVAAAAIAVGAFFTATRGLRTAFCLAAPAAAFAGSAAIGIETLLPQSSLVHFYRAIAIEYVVILLVAMLIAIGVPYWVEQRERSIG